MKTGVTFERRSFFREETEDISCKRKQLINWTSKLKLMLFKDTIRKMKNEAIR